MTDLTLRVSELFYSLQGESTYAGLPCCFIRLAGCNLRCQYCDSDYSWKESGTTMTVDEILSWLADYPGIMVELTGGEPLLQGNVYPLLERLVTLNHPVLLETNGSIAIDMVPDRVAVILDIKCPESGMAEHIHWPNLNLLAQRKKRGSRDEIKFVLSSENDFHWARKIISENNLSEIAVLLFSPVRNHLEATNLAALILRHRVPARMQLQLHKVLWPDVDRGV